MTQLLGVNGEGCESLRGVYVGQVRSHSGGAHAMGGRAGVIFASVDLLWVQLVGGSETGGRCELPLGAVFL